MVYPDESALMDDSESSYLTRADTENFATQTGVVVLGSPPLYTDGSYSSQE